MAPYRQIDLERFERVEPADPEEIKRSEKARAEKDDPELCRRIGFYPAAFGALKASYDRLWSEYQWLLEFSQKTLRERDAWEYTVEKLQNDDLFDFYTSMEEIREQLADGKMPR